MSRLGSRYNDRYRYILDQVSGSIFNLTLSSRFTMNEKHKIAQKVIGKAISKGSRYIYMGYGYESQIKDRANKYMEKLNNDTI